MNLTTEKLKQLLADPGHISEQNFQKADKQASTLIIKQEKYK